LLPLTPTASAEKFSIAAGGATVPQVLHLTQHYASADLESSLFFFEFSAKLATIESLIFYAFLVHKYVYVEFKIMYLLSHIYGVATIILLDYIFGCGWKE
jgi:hypothetical protein